VVVVAGSVDVVVARVVVVVANVVEVVVVGSAPESHAVARRASTPRITRDLFTGAT